MDGSVVRTGKVVVVLRSKGKGFVKDGTIYSKVLLTMMDTSSHFEHLPNTVLVLTSEHRAPPPPPPSYLKMVMRSAMQSATWKVLHM